MKKIAFLFLAALISSFVASAQTVLTNTGFDKVSRHMSYSQVPKQVAGVYDKITWKEDIPKEAFFDTKCTGTAYLNGVKQFEASTSKGRLKDNPQISSLTFFTDRFSISIDGHTLKVGMPLDKVKAVPGLKPTWDKKEYFTKHVYFKITDGKIAAIALRNY